jgi:hypothetical protein
VGTGSIGYTHIIALPALLLLTGCFGIPAATDPPPSVVVAPENTVTVVACTEAGADIGQNPLKVAAREAVCLKELGRRVSRKGKVLSLKLDNGTTKNFRNKNEGGSLDCESCVDYYLVGFYSTYSTAGAYLVHEQLDESYDETHYQLVNVHTGETKEVEGVPRFAPNNSTFFVKICSEGSCSLNIKSMASSAPAWEEADPGHWDFVRWIDNDRIALRVAQKTPRCPRGNCKAILKRTGSSWTIENLPARSDAK